MGLYDTPDRRRYILYGVVFFLLLLDVYLLLPRGVDVSISLDRERVPPGQEAILWVTVKNGSLSPLSGVSVRADSLSRFLEINGCVHVFDVPPGGEVTARFRVIVGESALTGDQLVRVFVSVPGHTDVHYAKVRIG